eukprot:COSAG02_NODE_47351_length_342_cov_0.386831_1_plen_97_part_10
MVAVSLKKHERSQRLADCIGDKFSRLPRDLAPLLETFEDFDRKGSGHISLGELLVGLWDHGLKIKRTEAADLLPFFKQKTAYEISECDWSSDVCSSD